MATTVASRCSDGNLKVAPSVALRHRDHMHADDWGSVVATRAGCSDGRAVVLRDGELLGIVSPSDISRAGALHGLGVQFGTGAVASAESARPRSSLGELDLD
jgi:hypothetical protein